MQKFDSRIGVIELTAERYGHITIFHPEIKSFHKHFGKTLIDPEIIRRSKSDPRVLIFYRKLSASKLLAIVVKTNARNFILTAYFTNKIKNQ